MSKKKSQVCLPTSWWLPSHFIFFLFDVKLLNLELYVFQINTLIANGDKTLLRKAVTENMYSVRITLSFCSSAMPTLRSSSLSHVFFTCSRLLTMQILFFLERKQNLCWIEDWYVDSNLLPRPHLQALKNEIKLRESKWNKVYWEMILPVVKIRTLRARLASIITLTFLFVLFMHLSGCSQ